MDYRAAWSKHAEYLLRRYGLEEARKITVEGINRNSPGTFSHTFHVAILKSLQNPKAMT